MVTPSAGASHPCFFERVVAELKKLFKHVPGWEASAAATLTYIAPLVEALIAITNPEVTPAVDLLLKKIQSAMAAAAVVVKDAGPVPTLVTYLNALTSDLSQVELAAGIKDTDTAQKLSTIVNMITTEVKAIQGAIAAI